MLSTAQYRSSSTSGKTTRSVLSEHAERLLTAYLQKEIALAIDVIRRDPLRRSDEDDGVLHLHHVVEIDADELPDLPHAVFEDDPIVVDQLGAPDHHPRARRLDAIEHLFGGDRGVIGVLPPLVDLHVAGVEIHFVRAGLRMPGARSGELDEPRRLEEGMTGEPMPERERISIEVLPELVGLFVEEIALYW